MDLDRASVTAASRIMLPTYTVFFAALGVNYLLTPQSRLTATPAIAYADRVMDLKGWGALFLGCSGIMLLALLTGRRGLYRYALFICAISMFVFTAVTFLAAFNTQASPAGWAYPALVMAACIASERSLNVRET